jgi:hypothetical protein
MSLDSTQVQVPGSASLYLAATGATAPTGLAAPGTAWTDAGYLDETGATWALNRTTQQITVWQSLDPVRIIQTAFTKQITMTLRQWNPGNLKYTLGGGSIAMGTGAAGGTAYGVYTYPAAQENPVVAAILDCSDGVNVTRFYYPSMQVDASVTSTVSRNDSMTLPLSLTSTASTVTPTITSNAPGFTA